MYRKETVLMKLFQAKKIKTKTKKQVGKKKQKTKPLGICHTLTVNENS